MKNGLRFPLTVLFALLLLVSCDTTTDPDTGAIIILGFFSYPTFFVNDGATIDNDDWLAPISGGEDIDDAVVTVRNDDTGAIQTLVYHPPGDYSTVGFYMLDSEFTHSAGQDVSVTIEAMGATFTGASTVTPDAYPTISAPQAYAQVSQPFNLTWTLGQETTPATHVIVSVKNYQLDPMVNTWVVLPATTTTYEVNGFEPADNYYLQVFPVNRMTISGGGKTFYAYVGTTSYRTNLISVEIIGTDNN